MNKLIKRQIKEYEKRIKELKEIKKKKLLSKFITEYELESIIFDYESEIDNLYRELGHT